MYCVQTRNEEHKHTKDIGRESSHDLGLLMNLANEREVRQGAIG